MSSVTTTLVHQMLKLNVNVNLVLILYLNSVSNPKRLSVGISYSVISLFQSTKAKVTLWSVDLIEGLNCWNML